jgi:hypothetical protein
MAVTNNNGFELDDWIYWQSLVFAIIYNNYQYVVTCPGFRDKKLIGSGLGEAVYWITRLQLQLQSLWNHVFQAMRPD